MAFEEDDLIPLSALQHYAYCPRQWALIHLEQVWSENRYTAEGRVLHERTDSGQSETRGDLHLARSLRLCSRRLGLTGIADVVEYHRTDADNGAALPGLAGRWLPFPVEYKRGRPKHADWDELQLCAQALCLEEMHSVAVPEGALFYGKTRRRKPVVFNEVLRHRVESMAETLHRLQRDARTPPPEFGPRCEHCSLADRCMPQAVTRKTATEYLNRQVDEILEDDAS
jgi:CRISPR-associated exonuclease Cas4